MLSRLSGSILNLSSQLTDVMWAELQMHFERLLIQKSEKPRETFLLVRVQCTSRLTRLRLHLTYIDETTLQTSLGLYVASVQITYFKFRFFELNSIIFLVQFVSRILSLFCVLKYNSLQIHTEAIGEYLCTFRKTHSKRRIDMTSCHNWKCIWSITCRQFSICVDDV